MFKKTTTLAAVAIVISAGVVSAGSHAEGEACMNMLATAIGLRLESEGVEVGNACNLSVADLATIKSLLDTDGMGARGQIEQIIADAGE